jgi:hypothetical protein
LEVFSDRAAGKGACSNHYACIYIYDALPVGRARDLGGVFSGRARREQPRYNRAVGASEYETVKSVWATDEPRGHERINGVSGMSDMEGKAAADIH